MFGLQVPLTKTIASADFDGVKTILYNSSLREPSHWLSKVDRNGEIFQLELEETTDTQDPSLLDKDCLCSCSDCATDDTGYGTDTDLYARKVDDDKSGLCHTEQILTEFDNVDYVLNNGCFEEILSSDSVQKSDKYFNQVEENIDSLFQGVNIDSQFDELDTFSDTIPSNIDYFFSKGNVANYMGENDYTDIAIMNDLEEGLKRKNSKPKISKLPQKTNSNKCECGGKTSGSSMKQEVCVTLKLRPCRTLSDHLNTVELCEQILGIVPGHYGSNQGGTQHHRRRDRSIKVRGLVPSGLSSRYTDIHVGDCLLSVNDQSVSWDNLKSVLQVLLLQKQATLVLRRSKKQKDSSSVLVKKRAQSANGRLVQLVTGSNSFTSVEDVNQGDWEPFYGALYLSLDGVSSENMQAKEDIVYQFPHVDNKVINSRGMFITLAGTMTDATKSTIQSTTFVVDNQPVHVVYQCEGTNLFIMSVPEHRFSLSALTSLVKDLTRLLQITHGSVHQAFSSPANHNQLNCFFALLHQSFVSRSRNNDTACSDSCNLSQSVKILPLPNEIKTCVDSVLTEFEAADFGDMSDSYYGCRRSYSVLGTCLLYKHYLMANHLPKDDLVDFTTYLKYHSLLDLTSNQSLGQLVVWREVYPIRQCHSVPEEQSFGYTEPLIARWFWLIVGYKHMIMCIMLETGGCTTVTDGTSPPDPFLIDQARAVLMQMDSQGISSHCQNSIINPINPLVSKPDVYCKNNQHQHDLLSWSIKKLPHKESGQIGTISSFSENHGSLRRVLQKRKDSFTSDNSSESSGDSFFKFSWKGRLFPETTDLLHNITESKENIGPVNTNRKLTVGADNCLFYFHYYDNLEGVFISSGQGEGVIPTINKEIYGCFQKACQQIKKVFDNARKIKEQYKDKKEHILGLNDDFTTVREEGVMFTCPSPSHDKKSPPLCYWVVGRCLSRSLKREVYVCFHSSTPQTAIELAFKLALGYLPL